MRFSIRTTLLATAVLAIAMCQLRVTTSEIYYIGNVVSSQRIYSCSWAGIYLFSVEGEMPEGWEVDL